MTFQPEPTASPFSTSPGGTHPEGSAFKLRLIGVLVRREIEGRYRGAGLGLVWTIVTPLLMLGVYTFVFGTVFRSRWATSSADASPAEFAVILFVGLILFQLLAETVNRAPSLMITNTSYVKKVVFPLEILVPVALGTALFHACISLLVLLPFIFWVFGDIPVTAVFLPFVIAPLILMILGISWFLASVGTYLRDVGQFVGTAVTALLFMAPIFFPLSALPVWLQPWLVLNPLTVPVQQARDVLIFGQLPDFAQLAGYTLVSMTVCLLGYIFFQKTRKGFADVL